MRATLAFACLAVACGKGGGDAVVVKKPVGPAVDEKTAEKDARGLATELVETLARGSKDSLFGLLDPEMFVFGPRRSDAFNRPDALVELGKILDPKNKKGIAVKSGKLEIAASLGGRSAWAFDSVTIKGEPYGVTAILVNANDIWQVEAAVIAPMPTRFAIKSEAGKDAVVPVGATAKGKTDPGANGAVDRYRKGLVDNELFGGDLTGRAGALVIGPGVGEVARGKTDIKEMWAKRVETRTRAIPSGDIISHVTPDGQLAWVSSPITQVTDKGEVLPMRAFAVFEKASGDWKLIVLHESLALDTAGAGTAFKKILPPAPKDDPKGGVVAKKVDDEKPKKDKKVGKKTQDADDEDEKPKAKKDDKKVGKKVKADDEDEDETPKKKDDPKKIAADKKKAEEDKKADAKKALAEKKKAEEDKKAEAKKALAESKKADEEKKAEAKKAALDKKKAEDEKKVADKKKAAKKSDDDDDEKPKKVADKKKKPADDDDDDKPKKAAKKDPKAKKEAVDPDKEYERYPGKKKPKQTEEEQYEARKKAKQKAEEDEKAKAKEKADDEKAKVKKKADDEKAKKAKKKADDEDEDEKPKKKKVEEDDEEDEKPKKKPDDAKAKKKEADDKKKKEADAKAKKKGADDKKKKKEPVEEDEDRVIAD